MIKKCDAKCGADCDANLSHLWLRNNIFYYRVELPRKNNKRRYYCWNGKEEDIKNKLLY